MERRMALRWSPVALTVLLLATLGGEVRAASPIPATKSNHFASNLQYTGGSGTGYTLEQVRWGDHHTFERIVFEFSSPSPEGAQTLPRMKVETEFYPMRLAIRLPGSDLRRKEIYLSTEPFRKSQLISRVDGFDVCGGGQHLTIVPARPVEFEVFTLTSPPRLVVDVMLSRTDPMREEVKYSVRTFALYGDQVCLLLEEAADAGVTPRLLTDAQGNVFAELGLYDDPGTAFAAAERLKPTLGKQFALVVKAREMMAVPAVVP